MSMLHAGNLKMKNVNITNEVAIDLCTKLSVLKNTSNHVRLSIGTKNLGDGLAATAVIVNGGCMAEIGFKTLLPKGDIEIPENGAWMSFIVRASDFCSYLSALTAYSADITLGYDSSVVNMSVGKDVKLRPLSTVSVDGAEPMLMHDYDAALAKVEVDNSFLPSLLKGGFLGETAADTRQVRDRIGFRFVENVCYSYSSNGSAVSKAWCTVKQELNISKRAFYYLGEKGVGMDAEGKKALLERLRTVEKDPAGLVALAEEEGFSKESPLCFSLLTGAYSVLLKLFGGAEKLMLMITPKNLHVKSGNILATFSLAGDIPRIYNTVDTWEKASWDAKAVFDKDVITRSLQLVMLGEKNTPMELSSDSKNIIISKDGAVVKTAITESEGSVDSVHVALDTRLVLTCVSKLSAGNLVFRCMTAADSESSPVSISNGDLTEVVSSYIYIIPVVGGSDEEEATEETAEEE